MSAQPHLPQQPSTHPILTQYLNAFNKQLALYTDAQTTSTIPSSQPNQSIKQLSTSQSKSSFSQIALQPITFKTKPTPLDEPQPQHEAIIHLSPTEAAIFKTIRKIVQYYQLTCNPRVAGGWVRDKLLHKESHDIDIALEGMEGETFAEYIKLYSETIDDDESFPTGKRISSISVIKSNPTQSKHLNTATFVLHGLPIDVSNLRTEVYAIDSRIPMMQMGSVRDDVIRRDFTCNALFYNIMTEEIEDICGRSKYDLDNKILSTPLHAFKTFNDDPLRILRCVRFASRLRFTIDTPIYYAASHFSTHLNLVKKVSRERYGIELKKMFESFSTIQFSTSLLCQWKLRPIIFMLPISHFKEFKAPPPLVKGKLKQDEQKLLLQSLPNDDYELKSQISINHTAALRFPMYTLYDLAPRTILQALFPTEFTQIIESLHEELMPEYPLPLHSITHNTTNITNNTMNDDIHELNTQQQSHSLLPTPLHFKQKHYSYEFAPYTHNDPIVTTLHPFQIEQYHKDLRDHYIKNKNRIRESFYKTSDCYDVEYVHNNNPYTPILFPKVTHNNQDATGQHNEQIISINNTPQQQRITRPRPQYPPPLSFFTMHEDTCLTSLCSQSLSSFRILCEKIYQEYFCVLSLPTLPTLVQTHNNQSTTIPSTIINTISSTSSSQQSMSDNDQQTTLIPPLFTSFPINDELYQQYSKIFLEQIDDDQTQSIPPPIHEEQVCIRVHSNKQQSRTIPIHETIDIPLNVFHEHYQGELNHDSQLLLQQCNQSNVQLQDEIYDMFHITNASQIYNEKINSTSTSTSTTTPTKPTTLPTKILVYRRDFQSRDDCLSTSGTDIDTYTFTIPTTTSINTNMSNTTNITNFSNQDTNLNSLPHSTNQHQKVQIIDKTRKALSIVPINPAIFVPNFDSEDSFKSASQSTQQPYIPIYNDQYAIERALLSIITTTSVPTNPLSSMFYATTLQNTEQLSTVSSKLHLEKIREKIVVIQTQQQKQILLEEIMSILPTTPNQHATPTAPNQSSPSTQQPLQQQHITPPVDENGIIIDTEPILTQRQQTPFTPTNDVFRIALYASFLWPYYGYNIVEKKGRVKSLLFHFLVDSLKLSVVEGETIEIIIESALQLIQLSYQWADIVETIEKQINNDMNNNQQQLQLHCMNTTSPFHTHSMTPINNISLYSIDTILAQRITNIQTQIGSMIIKTISTLSPGVSTLTSLSPMIYNSTMDLMVLLAFNIQTVMNMPLYKLPQPQHRLTIKSTLQFTPPTMINYSSNDNNQSNQTNANISPSHNNNQNHSLTPLTLHHNNSTNLQCSGNTTPSLSKQFSTSQLNSSCSVVADKHERQLSRTARLTEVLKVHPLVIASSSQNRSMSCDENENIIDEDNNNNDENQSQQQQIPSTTTMNDDTMTTSSMTLNTTTTATTTPIKKFRTTTHNQPTNNVQLQELETDNIGREHGDTITIYEPLSPSTTQVPFHSLPLPLQQHYTELSSVQLHPQQCEYQSPILPTNILKTPIHEIDSDNTTTNNNNITTTTTTTPSTTPTPISTLSNFISTSLSPASSIQQQQAMMLTTQSHMSQYMKLIPPQQRHTPYIHTEIPSTYSLFCFPGLSTQLEFKTVTEHDDNNNHNHNISQQHTNNNSPLSTPLSLSSSPIQEDAELEKIQQYIDQQYDQLKQITPTISLQRKVNLDSLPAVTYTPHHVFLTQHGFNYLYQHNPSMLSINNENGNNNTNLTMSYLLQLFIQQIAKDEYIDLYDHTNIDVSNWPYFDLTTMNTNQTIQQLISSHLTQQKQSLLLIVGLSRGFLRFRTTDIALFAQSTIYTTNNTSFSPHCLHALKRPLLPGSDAVRLTKKYQQLYTQHNELYKQQQQLQQQLENNEVNPNTLPTISQPPLKSYLSLQGPILGKLLEHLNELKFWYPYLDKNDIFCCVEKLQRFELIPAHNGVNEQIYQILHSKNGK